MVHECQRRIRWHFQLKDSDADPLIANHQLLIFRRGGRDSNGTPPMQRSQIPLALSGTCGGQNWCGMAGRAGRLPATG